ncbi:MAG: terminase, partial [Patescibacteria group bacterium]
MPPKGTPQDEEALVRLLHRPDVKDNLVNFVRAVYPWGQAGTVLERSDGPKAWQRDDLEALSDHILENRHRMAQGQTPRMWKSATAAGRGPGKSAKVAWIAHWMATTRLGSTTIVTANTEMQLKSRTFAEISKWMNLSLNSHWFEASVLAIRPAPWFAKLVKDQLAIDTGYYYVQGQLWSEENPDAFAGVHNPLGVCLLFDEASGIPTKIFTVSTYFFTEPTLDRYWFVQSNPRRNSGGFYDCFHDPDTDWRLRHLDVRTVGEL